MKGTEKQIAWAQDIINTFVSILDKGIATDEASIAKRIAKGKKATFSIQLRDEKVALKNSILSAEDVDAAKVIEYGKAINAAKDIEGAFGSMDIEGAWKAITR